MNGSRLAIAVAATCALLTVLGAGVSVKAQSQKPTYVKMAPLDQYLMDRSAEIVLARSAAPDSISSDAKILVLGRHSYETAVEGKNGFTCAVERAWMNAFNAPEFWNPKLRGAICYSPAAARTILPGVEKRTELVLACLSQAKIAESLKSAYANHELPALEAGAMSYMMSKSAYLTDSGGHNLAHLMFYTPQGTNWGADLKGSPVSVVLKGSTDPYDIIIAPLGHWSDGTPVPQG